MAGQVGAFWSLMNLVAFIKNDTQALVRRLMSLRVRGRA